MRLRTPPSQGFLLGYTDSEGNYSMEYNGNDTLSVKASFVGQRVDVHSAAGPACHVTDTELAVPPYDDPVDFELNDGPVSGCPDEPNEFSTAQVNCALHATLAHDFFAERQAGFSLPQIRCNVNGDQRTCNASFSGTEVSLTFDQAGDGTCGLYCENTAYSAIIAHEYGHYVVDQLVTGSGLPQIAFGEGFGDALAVLLYDDAVYGRGFCGENRFVRDVMCRSITYPCTPCPTCSPPSCDPCDPPPCDECEFECRMQVGEHYCGQLLARLWWDMKVNFQDTLSEEEGLELARQLFTGWTLITAGFEPGNGMNSAHPETAVEVLTMDDDDGDLSNGTPHDCAVFVALADRDIPSLLPFPDSNQNNLPDYCECPGGTVAECCDLDMNGIRDDNCVWCSCVDLGVQTNVCNRIDLTTFADAGGSFGACPPDGFCNIHDRNHALNCFAGKNPCDDINIDIGGSFGACPPDGFCNIHDAYHADNCFKGVNPCSCPGGSPAPMMGPEFGGATGLVAVPVLVSLSPNVRRVRIYTTAALADIQGYQLDVVVSGGTTGQLELLDISIEPRADFVFAGRTDTYDAFNLTNGQMLCGLDGDGVATTGPAYLATYTYRVPLTASGDFVLDIRRDEAAGDQTFLIASGNARIDVSTTTPAVIMATAAVVP